MALVGCGSKSAPPATPTPTAAAPTITPGDGWTAGDAPGQWVWREESGTDSIMAELEASQGGHGILALALPAGATSAHLVNLNVTYAAPGEATWSLFTQAADGEPSGTPVTQPITISPDDTVHLGDVSVYGPHTEVTFAAAPRLTGPFFFVFATVSGYPAVAAISGEGHVRYQEADSTTSSAAPYRAFIRVVIDDVK